MQITEGYYIDNAVNVILNLDPHSDEGLLNKMSLPGVVQAMNCQPGTGDLQKWGCVSLKYIYFGWDTITEQPTEGTVPEPAAAETSTTAQVPPAPANDSMGQAFLSTGAVVCVTNALENHKTNEGVVREAISLLFHLAKDSPSIRAHLIAGGAVQILADILQKKHWKEVPSDVQSAAQEAILITLAKE